MILYSPMVFDAGETRSLWTFVITLWTYPVTVLGAVIVSWILFALRCHRAAIACALLPLLHLGVLAVQIFVVGDGR